MRSILPSTSVVYNLIMRSIGVDACSIGLTNRNQRQRGTRPSIIHIVARRPYMFAIQCDIQCDRTCTILFRAINAYGKCLPPACRIRNNTSTSYTWSERLYCAVDKYKCNIYDLHLPVKTNRSTLLLCTLLLLSTSPSCTTRSRTYCVNLRHAHMAHHGRLHSF